MGATDDQTLIPWPAAAGGVISCNEKIKVLNDNLRELEMMMQDALDDATLMGCDPEAVRQRFSALAAGLHSSYADHP